MAADTGESGGLSRFWEQADNEASGQNPLERELAERLDALTRYRRLILEMEASDRSVDADVLLRQHDREYQLVQRLWSAIRRARAEGVLPPGGSAGPLVEPDPPASSD